MASKNGNYIASRPKTTCQGQGANSRPKRKGKKKLRGQGR